MDLKHWGRGRRFIKNIPKAELVAADINHLKGTPNWFSGATETYDSAFECVGAYGAKLLKKGYQRLGCGAYSGVYHKSGNRAIKVSRRIDPWWEYVQWAYESGHKEFAPEVYSYKYHPGKKQPFYVAVVCKLENSVSREENEHYFTHGFFNYFMFGGKTNTKIQHVAELLAPGIVQFAKDFYERFYKKDYSTDCYGSNMMHSKDGKRWILNDPLCGSAKNDNLIKTRWRMVA